MDRLDPEVLKMIADALHETVQCPVCLATLRPPVTQCSSGHGLCPDCKPHVTACPICREAFIDTQPIVLHQLLDALPRTCQFKTLGCTEVYLPGGKHEDTCSYRTVDCKVAECDWSGQSRKLKAHLITDHSSTVIILDDMRSELKWENFDCSQDRFKYTPVVAYNEVFWEYTYMNTEVNKLCVSFTHVQIDLISNDYFAVVSLKSGDIAYAYTIKIPADNRDTFIDFFEESCMTVPGHMLPRFVTESSLVYNVHIIKENKRY